MDTPFAPLPAASPLTPPLVPGYASDAPRYKLHLPGGATLATFLGSPVAGTLILALNYQKLGRSGAAVLSVIVGVLATILILALALMLPAKTPNALFIIPQIAVMAALAKSLQGPAVERHKQLGGKIASMWVSAGIGLVGLVVFGSAIIGYVYLSAPNLGKNIVIGTKDEVYYKGAATAQDAQALGQALKGVGFFTDRGVSVALSKGPEGTIISFVVQEGAWNDPTVAPQFDLIGRAVAPSIGGLPVTIRLMNDKTEVKKEFVVK